MKMKGYITVGLLAYTSYRVYKNRKAIRSQLHSAKESFQAAQESLLDIGESLERIAQQKENLQAINQDLSYKGRVFNQEVQAYLKQMSAILEKYQDKRP
ncbi:chemotaxis protein [Streptococcus sp. H49]|uniref:chemotaxis protein n=1 Tax=Streptococcus huangxiaojuni TaxID=3237239 RepID=UPI0034A2A7A4